MHCFNGYSTIREKHKKELFLLFVSFADNAVSRLLNHDLFRPQFFFLRQGQGQNTVL